MSVAEEHSSLRSRIEALASIDLSPPLAKEGYLIALKDVLALLPREQDALDHVKEPDKMRTYRDLYPNRARWANPLWFDACADLSEGATNDQPQGCQTTNHNNVYICTRPANHEGPHVADDGDMVVDVWAD